MKSYEDFVASKSRIVKPSGFTVDAVHESLFPFQADLTKWALKRGRAALFASTGLGKSRMASSWSDNVVRHTGKPVLILTPLAVAPQFVKEGAKIGVDIKLCREASDVSPGVNVTNYDRLHRFDTSVFGGVVADESSVVKSFDSATLAQLLELFKDTQYKLSATATPSPNDYTELGNQAEWLGVCRRTEMLAEFFVHDGGETQVWRLKRHAQKEFWKWMASWAAMVRRPSDLGYEDGLYLLPPLNVHHHTCESSLADARAAGNLFVTQATDLMDRRRARKASMSERVRMCVDVVMKEPNESWLIWGDLNAETEALADLIPDAVEVAGRHDNDTKEERLTGFAEGKYRVLVSKSVLAGWGMNFQVCSHMAFVGVSDSYEAQYQSIRRCWRFGQTRPVEVHMFASEAEGSVVANLKRKEADAEKMAEELSAQTRDAVLAEVRGITRYTLDYNPTVKMKIPTWLRTEA